jgi:hypothetical protein
MTTGNVSLSVCIVIIALFRPKLEAEGGLQSVSVPLPFKAVSVIHMPNFFSSIFTLFLFVFCPSRCYLIFVRFLPSPSPLSLFLPVCYRVAKTASLPRRQIPSYMVEQRLPTVRHPVADAELTNAVRIPTAHAIRDGRRRLRHFIRTLQGSR